MITAELELTVEAVLADHVRYFVDKNHLEFITEAEMEILLNAPPEKDVRIIFRDRWRKREEAYRTRVEYCGHKFVCSHPRPFPS